MSPFHPEPPQRTVELPTVGARYQVLRRIGDGGMATVYLAMDEVTGRNVALKVIKPELADRDDIRTRLDSEARAMQRIRHPNVVQVLDVDAWGPTPFIALEYLEGGSLYDRIRSTGPMTTVDAVRAMIEICAGVEAAHRAGLVHRDIKPHNVLISAEARWKVTDFGIAQSEDSFLTRTGTSLGTFGYMAPEQRRDATSVDERADIYSLGATLHHLVTARTVPDLFLANRERSMLANVHPVLQPIVIRAAQFEPGDRHSSAKALADDLLDALNKLAPTLGDVVSRRMVEGFPQPASAGPTPGTLETRELGPPPVPVGIATSTPRAGPRVRQHDGESDIPDYVDRSSLPAPRRTYTVELDDHSRKSTEKVLKKRALPAPPAIDTALAVKLAVVGALALGTATWATTSVWLAARDVRSTEARALEARDQLYQSVQTQAPVVADLELLGGNGNALAIALQDVMLEPGEPSRSKLAAAYIDSVSETAGRLAQGQTPRERTARVRAVALERSWAQFADARTAVQISRERAAAGWAVTLGMLHPPESSGL